METVESRSESPITRNKAKANSTNSENDTSVIEQVKSKKRSLKNKNKLPSNGSEHDDIVNTEDEENPADNETVNNSENNSDNGNEAVVIENGIENLNGTEEVERNDDEALNNVPEEATKELVVDAPEESNTDIIVNTEDCSQITAETESCAKNEVITSCDSMTENEIRQENVNESYKEETHEVVKEQTLNGDASSFAEENLEVESSVQMNGNGSDSSSHYEEANGIEESNTQASPDRVTKGENSISNKISSYFEKWTNSAEIKQDSEVSSSKKTDEVLPTHPSLSKIRGRPGIRDRLNSSATVFGSNCEAKTPENSFVSLDDSFRVRTNPPRLTSLDLKENTTLRKFRGKRCLNAGDEPEEDDEAYLNNLKRMKVDEKVQESGILGGLLWSPFKKKSIDEGPLKIGTAESKLSRLLSPFWFWKRNAAQKGK